MIVLINPDDRRAVRNKEALPGFYELAVNSKKPREARLQPAGTPRRRCSVGRFRPAAGQPERDVLNAAAFTLSHLNYPVVGSVIP
jgi:hypothetical protein